MFFLPLLVSVILLLPCILYLGIDGDYGVLCILWIFLFGICTGIVLVLHLLTGYLKNNWG